VTQPAVSQAVKKLEERFGAQLLLRNRKRVTASSAGGTLARGAMVAFEALGEAVDQIADELSEPRGRIRLGCHESLGAYALPGFMARFLRSYPAVELTLWNGTSREVERALVDGRVDLGLVVNPSRHPDTVVQPLFKDTVELIHSERVAVPATELLASLPLLYVPELVQSQHILAALGKRKLAAARLLPCSSLELVKNLVLDRVGVGILPHRVAAHGVPRGRLRSASPPLPRYRDQVALVRRYDLPRTAAIRVATERLLAHGRRLASRDPG
jgi:DNA-binding transcriptional LysR family regulator